MHIDQRKEQFSKAYVHAVASVAGFATYTPSVDDDSVDLGVSARGGADTPRRPRLEMQLKCTHTDTGDGDHLTYPLKLKNYDDLRAETIVPRILVVVLVPEDINSWLHCTEAEMCVRRCAYWASLHGMPATTNTTSVTISLPRTALLTPEELRSIMRRVNDGETL
jgi:hypothetical protein